ncbi:hypothetical protein E2C01_013237 [Portunus trituberculatus]|uniref:Uncharacterized protein n=1 Tax=Portunus trituberculatus TaxID=210409 RepID=A0A5B7DG40_PORTR|nr:hypothetical protein [Portunus trituberculatus]
MIVKLYLNEASGHPHKEHYHYQLELPSPPSPLPLLQRHSQTLTAPQAVSLRPFRPPNIKLEVTEEKKVESSLQCDKCVSHLHPPLPPLTCIGWVSRETVCDMKERLNGLKIVG